MRPDFRAIAARLIERGLRVVPVTPDKHVAIKNFQNFQITNQTQLDEFAAKFPHHNVGVVGKSGVDRIAIVDIDDKGVVERIERETKEKMPLTYTVQSRPDSAPHKKHLYFTQTPYSFKKFGPKPKNINRRDTTQLVPSPSGGLMYQTQYDVKGIGGGAIVVGAGSVRKPDATGHCEIYKSNDAEIIPFPKWLVDWLIEDKKAYRREFRREMAKKFARKMRAAKIAPEERERLRAAGHPDGFDICPEDRHRFLFSRAFKLAKTGLVGQPLEDMLAYLAMRHVEGGKAYAESERGRNSITGLAAHASKDWDDTKIVAFYKSKSDSIGDLVLVAPPVTRRDILRDTISEFPDLISVDDAEARLQEAMGLNGFDFDKRKDKDALYDIRHELGFEVGSLNWRRVGQNPDPGRPTPAVRGTPSSPFIYTGKRTRHVHSDETFGAYTTVRSDETFGANTAGKPLNDKEVKS